MTLPVVVLMATVSPASAQVEAAPTGVQTHLGVPYQGGPNNNPPPCARYSTYDANVTFPNNGNPYNVTVAKDPTKDHKFWDENPEGTYEATVGGQVPIPPPPGGCPAGTDGVVPIRGFLVTVVGGGFNCVNASATYQRKDYLFVTVRLVDPRPPGSVCPTEPIEYALAAVVNPAFPPPGFVTFCDGPASRVCLIGPKVTIP